MKLNFLVDNVGASQLGYCLIRNLNKLSDECADVSPIIFYADIEEPCVRPVKFPMMQLVELWNQPGPTIATSFSTAVRLLSMPRPGPRFLYVWDLEWIRMRPKVWNGLNSIMCDPDLHLIARCEDHVEAIEACFNVKVPYAIEDFNMKKILEAIEDVQTTVT